ncbi:uncharacterized protein B0T15DRAFT_402314 [Chaetomium strumarium]|uniref:Uncharacterized protein n=1 Tax=Chaetomium strumarium TaxID=1170767 RepID=A0AAJ0GPG4_9PEZI|nr:hypothetical protein B0T15DRAFT_402314 [Chaetomium strumarium]
MNEPGAGSGARTSPDVEQHCDHIKSPRYEYYKHEQEDLRSIAKEDKTDEKHHYSPLLPRGESSDLTRAYKHHRNQIANRPLRETGLHRPKRPANGSRPSRPESRSSNVSKQRSRCGSLASSPMLRQRRVAINHEFTTGMAGIINQFTQQQHEALEEQKVRYHKYIRRLRQELAEQSTHVARQTSQIDAQAKDLEDLHMSKQDLMKQLKDIEAKLRASEDRARRLEEKYRTCKTHLNSAIQEQQDLYTRSKKHWGEAIEQIDALTRQAEEKESELQKERDSVRALSQKLRDLQATSNNFEALAAQGTEILAKLGQQQEKAEEQHESSAKTIRDRQVFLEYGLDLVTNRLEALCSIASRQPDVLASIRQAQHESLNGVANKLDKILESRDAARDATGQLSTSLEAHMEKIWERLDHQLESLSKQLAEKAEENGMLSTLYRRKEAECEEHSKELAALRETTEKQAQQIHELDANLFAMDAAQDENEDKIRRLERSGAETSKLREELESKAAAMADLQRTLDAKERSFASELQKYASSLQKLALTVQEKDQSLGVATQQAAETARREARIDMERANAQAEKLLRETQQQRDSLAVELQSLKQKLQEKECNESRAAFTICSLQETLSKAEAKERMIAQDLEQRSANLEGLEIRLTSRVTDLEAQLRAAQARTAELEGQNRLQHTRFEALISGLKHWASQEALNTDALDSLGACDRSEEEIRAEVIRALEQLSFSPKLQSEIPGEHLNLLLREKNSESFLNEDIQGPRVDLKSQSKAGESAEDAAGRVLVKHTVTDENAAEGTSAENDPLPYASTLHHVRRVIVRSPASVPNEPIPPSIDQEKVRRRGALQPRSIMKRATRSASRELDTVTGPGVFKRKHDEYFTEGTTPDHPGREQMKTEAVPVWDAEPTESASAEARRRSRRRRPETATSNGSIGHSHSLKQAEGGGLPGSGEEPTANRQLQVPLQHGGEEGYHQQRHTFANGSQNIEARTTRSSRGNPAVGPPGSHRTSSANTGRALATRPANVRTYGTRKAERGLVTAAGKPDPQGALRSQSPSQSRYWPRRKEESQDTITFSQGVNADENLLLSLRD